MIWQPEESADRLEMTVEAHPFAAPLEQRVISRYLWGFNTVNLSMGFNR